MEHKTNMAHRTNARVLTMEIAQQWLVQKQKLSDGEEVTDDEYISLSPYEELESGVAAVLAKAPVYSIDLENLAHLSEQDASSLERYGGEIYLDRLTTLSPEVEKIVARFAADPLQLRNLAAIQTRELAKRLAQDETVFCKGTCDISEEAARVFARQKTAFVFDSTHRLTLATRKILVDGGCDLWICKTGKITLDDVRGFGQFGETRGGRILFSKATSISPDAAGELGGYPGTKIEFEKPTKISAKAAAGLARFPRTLKFLELKQLSAKAAVHLASSQIEVQGYTTRCASLPMVAISRHGIVVVKDKNFRPDQLAEVLVAPHIKFSHLVRLSLPVAALLAEKHVGTLQFNKVRALSPEIAAVLAKHRGGIAFDGLARLSPPVARKLAPLDGFLAFRGLTTLLPALAGELAKHAGRLILDGVEYLSSSTAEALVAHAGDISLTGLKDMSVKAARSLATKPGRKVMPNLRPSDAMMVLLKEDAERVVLPFHLNSHGEWT